MGAMRLFVVVLCGIALVGGCTGGGDGEPQEQGQRVDLEDLLAFETPLPDDVVGVDMGDLALGPMTFCEAMGTLPTRWVTGALFPMQGWRDAFAQVSDAPPRAQPAIDRLVSFVERRLRWSLTADGDRPVLDDELNADIVTLAEAAIEACPGLPLVAGLPGVSNKPSGWNDMTEDEVVEHCAGIARGVEEGIQEFVELVGRQPRHQIEMEARLMYFVASDWHGIAVDSDGQAVVVPIPDGGCDL